MILDLQTYRIGKQMSDNLRIVLAQLNFTVGDIDGNTKKIIEAIAKAKNEQHADLIIFPELAVTGYPLEDLLHRQCLFLQVDNAMKEICKQVKGIDVLLGYPEKSKRGTFNSAAWIRDGKIITNYHKHKLPNYSVFDEVRYFKYGKTEAIVEFKGVKFGIAICADVWTPAVIEKLKIAGAQCILSLNASPYSMHKSDKRHEILSERLKESGLPIVYLNLVGAQDELVFDGNSQVMNQQGEIVAHAGHCIENLLLIELDPNTMGFKKQAMPPLPSISKAVYEVLKLGVKDYVKKNNFPGVILGLSGGIDSALTLAIAVDALGADKVSTIMMPSQYTSEMSLEDAKQMANNLGVEYQNISIQSLYENFLTELGPYFSGMPADTTEENIQARIRCTMLMAFSNKTGKMLLTTGNKSEFSVGYSTLYGDLAGGFAVLKDIFKTSVYEISEYRNSIHPDIPQRIIDRPPSAELADNQLDENSLPPYSILDQILKYFVEQDLSMDEIIRKGFDEKTVKRIVKLVLRNEYKRRQSPIGVRISEKAFGRDRRYPITSGYLKGEL